MTKQKLNRALVAHAKPAGGAKEERPRRPTWRPKEGWLEYKVHRQVDQSIILTTFVALLEALTDEEVWAHHARGRKGFDPRVVLKVLAVRFLFRLSTARALGMVGILRAPLHVPADCKLPSEETLNRRLRQGVFSPLLDRLLTLSLEGVQEDTLAVDSTGFADRRHERRQWSTHGKKHPKGWLKCHLCSGTTTLRIYALRVTRGEAGDAPETPPLLKAARARSRHPRHVLGDTAYATRNVCTAAEQNGLQPTMKPRKDANQQAQGHPAYPRMIRRFRKDPEAYLTRYHRRSTIESLNHALKHRLGDTLWSRHPTAQTGELWMKAILHNLGRPARL